MRRWSLILVLTVFVVVSLLLPFGFLVWASGGGAIPSPARIIRWAVLLAILSLAFIGLTVFLKVRKPGPDIARRWRWVGAFAGPGVYLILMTIFALSRGGSVVARLVDSIPMAMTMFGISIVGLAVTRTGTGKYCSKCGYELSPAMEAGSGPDSRCSECGSMWLALGGTVVGKKKISKAVIAAGALLTVAPFLVLFGKIGNPSLRTATLKFLPTSSLISEVTAAPAGFTMDEWAVLGKRTLTAPQKIALATGLLEQRERRQYLAREAEGWMESQALAGTLPLELRERYFRGMLKVWIDAPDRVKAGEPFTLGLGSDHRGTLATPTLTKLQVFVCFSGFRVGDAPERLARADKPAYAIRFGRVSQAFGKTETNPAPSPIAEVTPAAAGKLHVTADYWLVIAPPGAVAAGLTWNPDGSLAVPVGTAWAEHIQIDKHIVAE